MEPLEQLRRAQHEFARRVALVGPEDLTRRTPCPDWDVAALINHVVGADRAYVALLHGDSAPEFARIMSRTRLGRDPAGDFAESSAALLEAISRPAVLDRVVHHPVGEITGAQLLGMRVTDWTVHGWDLARAIGADESIDAELAVALLDRMLARGEALYSTGYFRRGRGVPESAPPEVRLLDVLGRDPAAGVTSE
jgi:uncharacterized protein (TIGR03086 family)